MKLSRVVYLWVFSFMSVCICSAMPTRRALVIGNDSYPGNTLHNARNDARGMYKHLTLLGYKSVLLLDVNMKDLTRGVGDFVSSVTPGDLTLVYYSGHGLQMAGENYLIPTDFRVSAPGDVAVQGYPLSSLLRELVQHGSQTQVIILDACRDNPFLSSRSTGSGWATVSASEGTFLAFGTAPGSTASDNPQEDHGLFTKSMLDLIDQPLEVDQLFQQIRREVVKASRGSQVPWTASSLVGSLSLSVPRFSQRDQSADDNMTGDKPSRFVQQHAMSFRELESNQESYTTNPALELAMAQTRRLNLDGALNTVKAVLSLDPRSALAMRLLGLILHLLGRSDEAKKAFDTSITTYPNDALALSYRCLITAGVDASSAEQDCRRAIQIQDDLPQAHWGLALSLQFEGRPDESLAEANRQVEQNPDMPMAYSVRAEIERIQHRRDLARQDYLRANALTAGAPGPN